MPRSGHFLGTRSSGESRHSIDACFVSAPRMVLHQITPDRPFRYRRGDFSATCWTDRRLRTGSRSVGPSDLSAPVP
jgi:hypothetical protein